MSQENVEVVRQPLAVRAHSRRRLEERLALRLPRASALVGRAAFRLPPRSRLRRIFIRRPAQLAFEAFNRRDYEAAFALFHAEVEFEPPPQVQGLGLDATRGREARIRFEERWTAEWGDFQLKPAEIVDVGDGRLLIVGRIVGSGLASGAAIDSEWGDVDTVSAGRVIRQQLFLDHAEALEAAGLSE